MNPPSLKLFSYSFISLFFILLFLSTQAFSEKPSISISILENPESNPIIETLPKIDIEREISTVLIGSGYRLTTEPSSDIRLETYVGIRATESKTVGEITYNTIANVFIRARDREGKLMTEVSDSSYKTGLAIGDTSLDALKIAGAGAAKKLRSELGKRDKHFAEEGVIEISFNGFRNYIQYERIDELLAKSIPGVSVKKRLFRSGGNVSFQVSSNIDADTLATTIQRLLPGDMPMELEQSSYDKIRFSLN